MVKYLKTSSCLAAGAVAVLAASAGGAMAQDKVSGSFGASYNTHFVSYGLDVWGAGDDWYSDEATMFAWADIGFDFDPVTLNFGIWGDINNNAAPSIGGDIQEIDWYVSLGTTAGLFSLGATYQEWNYAADVEKVIDLSVGLDDSGFMPVPLNPSLVWHFRIDGNGAQTKSSAIVASISPSFDLTPSLSLSVPIGISYFVDDDFQGGTDGGIGYGYFGGSLGIPLSFVSSEFGEWSLSLDALYYLTDSDAIPGNVESDFLTTSVGFSVAF